MSPQPVLLSEKSRLAVLLEHFAAIDDPRDVRRITHPLAEILLLVVCGTIADCDDYDHIAAWGEAHLDFLRRHLPYKDGVPGGRWLTILMNRINPALFCSVFTAWVRGTWPDRPDFVATYGKTSRRSHDRAAGEEAIHLVSAFATTSRLVLGQEAVPSKAGELTAIPVLLARLAEQDGLRGALVSIDAIATNATIATAIQDAGADYLLAVKANQPGLRAEVQACIVRVHTRIERGGKRHEETRFYICSALLEAEQAGQAVRGHWDIENRLHWVLDVTFNDDQSRLRKGFGARNTAVVRHFALTLVRAAKDTRSIKLRRKLAGWTPAYLDQILNERVR